MTRLIPRLMACLLVASPFSFAAHASPLFTENFNAEISVKGRHRQTQTGLSIKHGYDAMPGWTRLGEGMPAHFVEHPPGDWALMVVAREPNQNIFTLKKGFAANDMGHTYTVSFDVGPAVYQGLSQVTTTEEQLAIELLRSDDTVLKRHQVRPGNWEAQRVLRNCTFTYQGDGTGPIRFRISPVFTSGTRFYGAIDNLQVFGSKAEAENAVKKRMADARRAGEELERQRRLIEQLPSLERDWMFQAGDNPTVEHVQQEISWTRELAERIGKASSKLDLTAELDQLGELEEKLGVVRELSGRNGASALPLTGRTPRELVRGRRQTRQIPSGCWSASCEIIKRGVRSNALSELLCFHLQETWEQCARPDVTTLEDL